ncbi:mitochondrial basic amino acids transporter-like isoform X1 [Apostichopus japonicus]|uniref:mitochondrial basic amino acids transporter-like isoform X1 n=2 Tax=Stichopus japonicus TaxID=307972 RepID=UPI003AB84F6B
MAEEFEAGWISGLAQVAIGHPLDTIKVRLQAQGGTKARYRGTIHCVTSIIRHESMLGMFKGMLSPMLSITAINSILFGVRGNLLKYYESPTLLNHYMAGSAAGATQVVISCPSELAKIRMQMSGVGEKTDIRGYKGSLRTLKAIYRIEGMRGCYRGLIVTAARDVPAFGFYFMTYEASRREFVKRNLPEVMTEAVAGGLGGVASWVLTYAVDSIKSRVQADGVGGVNKYKGLADAVYLSVKHDGIFDLHKGLGVAVTRAFAVNALIFTVFIYSRKFLVERKGLVK